MEEEEAESQVSNIETQMGTDGQGEQVETAPVAASATQLEMPSRRVPQLESACSTREEENHQDEAKLDEHVGISQIQENEHVVAEFGVDLGLDNGITQPNSEEGSGGVEGTAREPEVANAAGVPLRVEKRSNGEDTDYDGRCGSGARKLGGTCNGEKPQIERNRRRRASRRAARTTVGEARLRKNNGTEGLRGGADRRGRELRRAGPPRPGLMNVMRRLRVAVPRVLLRGRRHGTDPHPNPLPQGEGIVKRPPPRRSAEQSRPRAKAQFRRESDYIFITPRQPPLGKGGRGLWAGLR